MRDKRCPLTEADIELLAGYWCCFLRKGNLGHFIIRVAKLTAIRIKQQEK